MTEIRLPGGTWLVDFAKPLGPAGGFGAVFVGQTPEGGPVAIKRLHLTAGEAAHRELAIAHELRRVDSEHVISILDAGQDAESDRYFIVMPIADESLSDYVGREGIVEPGVAVAILLEIAAGLAEVPDIVHRDLKPANVLRLGGHWHVADFGIARFVEASTSSKTLREALTPAFAAPEQWRLERASQATDVYALGCIASVLLTGQPPFVGSIDEVREAHLNAVPTLPGHLPSALRSLVLMMLRKAPDARPSLDRVQAICRSFLAGPPAPGAGLARLAAAAARHDEEVSQAEAVRQQEAAVRAERAALAREAMRILETCFDELARQILAAVPGARITGAKDSRIVHVAGAALDLGLGGADAAIPRDAFPRSKWDVIAGAAIEVRDAAGRRRSASLWYTRRDTPKAQPRWYEVGYRGNPLTGRGFEHEPAAAGVEHADRAHSPAMDVVTTAYPPTPIDDEHLEPFCARWIYILTVAAEDRLNQLPGSLPTPE
jgi:serine/threonine-protein kinase